MNEKFLFFTYLLELYATQKKLPAILVLAEWDSHGITQEIYDSYDIYHIERIENAYKDIDCLLATGAHAY